MKVRKGENRVVIIFPTIGIAIKFPLIHFIDGFHVFLDDLRGKANRLHAELFEFTIEMYGSLKRFLFKGIVDNWREYRFYQTTKHPFLQPTYFSFFGFVNVQRFAQSCKFQDVDLWCQLYELTKGAVFKDAHHFTNPNNICMNDGALRIFDYGGLRVQEVISEFGEKIIQNFNPNYSWEERKKALKAERELSH